MAIFLEIHSSHIEIYWFLFPEHGEEGQKVVVAAVAVLDDGKDNLAVFILKLSLFHHLLEELCDVQWGIGKGSAAEGP